MPGPTNERIAIAHIDLDTAETVKRLCVAEGCTCGDALEVDVTVLSEEEGRRREAQGLPSGAKHCEVVILHRPSCPVLARTATN